MNIIETSIRRPVSVTVVVLLVLLFGSLGLLGIYDFLKLPIQLTPNVDQPMITVTTQWFGASPQEIAEEIVDEQEEVLKTVSGLREMISKSTEGQGVIELQFFVGVDKDAALNEVRDKLRQVPEYPLDVDEPVVRSVDSAADDFIAWMLLRPERGPDGSIRPARVTPAQSGIPGYSGDVTELQDFVEDEIQPVLERVPGVAEVNVFGGREREMQVRVDLEKLAARGISILEFNNALRNENANVTAGVIERGKSQTSIRAVGQYYDPEQIRDTVVAYTANGAPVYVRDVAEVELGFKRDLGFVRSRGEEVMAMNVKRETGSNVLAVMAGLKEAIKAVNRDVLGPRGLGLELHQVYDQTVYVNRSIENARGDLLLGAALAAVVLFLTLRSVGATLVIAVSIPISVIGTFLGMALTGRNLNVISMAGITFSIGMGIDNAIVVLENIFRHREMGKGRLQAAADGTREVWGAIVASVLTNVAVFVPILFIEEEAGQLFRDIAVAITIATALFLVIAPTVTPMLASLFLQRMPGVFRSDRQGARSETVLGRLTRPLARMGDGVAQGFYNTIFWLTGGVLVRLLLIAIMIGGATWLSMRLIPPQTYLPTGNQNLIFSILSPPPGYSIEEFRRMNQVVEARVSPWWNVEEGSPEHRELQARWRQMTDEQVIPAMEGMLQGMKAQMPPESYAEIERQFRPQIEGMRKSAAPPAIENFFFVARAGMVFMGASSEDPDNVAPLAYVLQGAVQGIPGTGGFAAQASIFRLGQITGGSLDVNVTGLNYEQVRAAAAQIQGRMAMRFGAFVQTDPSNFMLGRPELRVEPDRVRAAAAGVSTSLIREMARVAVEGQILGDYRLGGEAIDLTVVAKERFAVERDLEQLRDVPLATSDGRVIPFASVARFVETSAAQQINRVERQPAVTLSVSLPAHLTIQEAERIMNEEIIAPMRAGGEIPIGVYTRLTGSADKLQSFMKAFIPGFILAAIVTYLLLAALFESFLYPFVIIMSLPFAMVGGFIGLAILHYYTGALLDVLTMLGFVILIGVIVNNPILIVHQALNYIRGGMDRRQAIARSTQTRVRPIFMSVTTTLAALTPLVVLGGAGSELYRGLGSVVVGGLALSTVFTLFLTPTLMSLMLDAQSGVGGLLRRWRGDGPGAPGGPGGPPSPEREPRDVREPQEQPEEMVVARRASPGQA